MGKYLHSHVHHKTYGPGIVIEEHGNHIKVQFDSVTEIKKFDAGSAFGKFLMPVEAETQTDRPSQNSESIPRSVEKRKKTVKQPVLYKSYLDFIQLSDSELEKEIKTVASKGDRFTAIFDGKKIHTTASSNAYTFELEEEFSVPSGSIATLIYDKKTVQAEVIDIDGYIIMLGISIDDELPEKIPKAKISLSPLFILEQLRQRLRQSVSEPSGLSRKLIEDGPDQVEDDLKTGQNKALEMAVSQSITFIWGPPGTGKTHTLAKIIRRLLKEDKRILVLSYSNIAIDEIVLRLAHTLQNRTPGRILRIGYPKNKELLQDNELFISTYIGKHFGSSYKRYQQLKDLKKKTDRTDKKFAEIVLEINVIKLRK